MKFYRVASFVLLSGVFTHQTLAAGQLQFSPAFLQAVENCTPYEENVAKNNPDFASYMSPELSGVHMDFDVDVLGRNEQNLCAITFRQNIQGMASTAAECLLSDEQLEALLVALNDDATEEYSDTFALASDEQTSETPVKISVSGNLLHVVYQKILNASCRYSSAEVEDNVPDEAISAPPPQEEKSETSPKQVETFVQYDVFAPTFMKSWQTCRPDAMEQEGQDKLEILGVEQSHCKVKYGLFNLDIPLALMANIHSFADVETLLKNADIAHYSYQPEYVYDGLIYALEACMQQKGYDGREETMPKNKVLVRRGLYAEYINRQCVFHLQNELEIGGKVTDYSVLCTLNDKALQDLQPYFKEMLEAYGQKRMFTRNGKVEIHKAEFNAETHKGDIALMYYLQQKGFCKRP